MAEARHLPALLRLWDDPSETIRRTVLSELAAFGDALPELLDTLDQPPEAEVRAALLAAVQRSLEPATHGRGAATHDGASSGDAATGRGEPTVGDTPDDDDRPRRARPARGRGRRPTRRTRAAHDDAAMRRALDDPGRSGGDAQDADDAGGSSDAPRDDAPRDDAPNVADDVHDALHSEREADEHDEGLHDDRSSGAEGEAHATDGPRAPGGPRYDEGQIVRHRRYGYRGVVVHADPCCRASDAWYRSNRTRPPREQPWYYVLVSGTDQVTYAAQSNLIPDESDDEVRNQFVPVFFRGRQGPRYRRNDRPWPGWL